MESNNLRTIFITAMNKRPIRVAIVGIGNCASSIVQSYFCYNQWNGEGPAPGVMNWDLGGYTPRDILPVAAFDVDRRKIGTDITEAIFSGPNCAIRHFKEITSMKSDREPYAVSTSRTSIYW